MRDTGLISFLAGQRWALHAPVLEAACGVLSRHSRGAKLDAVSIGAIVDGRDQRQTDRRERWGVADGNAAAQAAKAYFMAGNVAVVPISGVLSKYADMINGMSQPSGMTSAEVSANILAAAKDRDAKSLLLDIDSPGGTVAGGSDMWDAVMQVKEAGMPVAAIAHDMAASGGYWLGLAADAFYLTDMAEVGSIGVYCVITDYSRADQNAGIITHVVASGVDKGVGAGAPVTHEQVATIKEDIDRMATAFKNAVAESRGLPMDIVEQLATGRTFVGQDAVDRGLADGVVTFRELIGVMNEQGI